MKYSRLHLESFETGAGAAEHVVKTLAELEEDRLAAFEQGYAAGWDDSNATREAEEAKIRLAIGQSLQEMSFTYHEARHHLLESIRPLVVAMVEKVVPAAARASLPEIVADQICAVGPPMTDSALVVTTNPGNVPTVQKLLSEQITPPFVVSADASLGAGQAFIRFSKAETRIDLDEVVARIASAIDSYFNENSRENRHG